MTDDVTFYDDIEAYCAPLSAGAGDSVSLHVSSRVETYDVLVERWGHERVAVASFQVDDAQFFEPQPGADSDGCGWPVAVTIPIEQSWNSGFYLVTLTAQRSDPGRNIAHACFVVRGSDSRTLLVLGTNTWNAYNTWGGASLYTGATTVSFERPFARGMLCRQEVDRDDRKARPVRWGEEPDDDGQIFQEYRFRNGYPAAIGSTGWFTHERRFVEWAEGEGRSFDYAISSDLDRDPACVADYDLVVLVGHDEYWSLAQREALEAHVGRGGNVVAFSGNTMFWQVRLEGAAMVCHKYVAHKEDPVRDETPHLISGIWADPLVGNPEWSLFGAGSAFGLYHRFGQATPRGSGAFTIYRHDHWLLDGTGLRYGDLLGSKHGVVGYETVGCRLTFDDHQLPVARRDTGLPSLVDPDHIEIVAFALSSNLGVGDYPASISALSDQGDLEFIADRVFGGSDADAIAKARYGNAVMLTCRPYGHDAGEVVTVGTTDWVFGLCDDPAVAQVTRNALTHLSGNNR